MIHSLVPLTAPISAAICSLSPTQLIDISLYYRAKVLELQHRPGRMHELFTKRNPATMHLLLPLV